MDRSFQVFGFDGDASSPFGSDLGINGPDWREACHGQPRRNRGKGRRSTAPSTPLRERLAAAVARVADMVSNPVAVEGHVRAYPIVLAKNPAWDESAQHAGHMRDLLWREGLDRDRVARVTAHADRDPAHDNPMDPRNTRLEVIFLRDR